MVTKTRSIRIFAVLIAVLMAALCSVAFVGCGDPADKKHEHEGGAQYYKVTFVANGGSSVAAQTVKSGETATVPTAPKRSGYTFGGWYTDKACTHRYDFKSAVEKDIKLYAGWNEALPEGATASVTFNVGREARLGGLSNPPAQTVKSGEKITAPTVKRSGYTLEGWYVEGGERKWDFANDKVENYTTLFAKWKSGSSDSEREDYTPTTSADNTLYIHYRRPQNDYDSWHVWTWLDKVPGRWVEASDFDKSGAIFAIDLEAMGVSGDKSIGFLVAKGDWELKDGEANNYLAIKDAQKVGGGYHWYVQSGSVANGTPYLGKPAEIDPGKTEKPRASVSDVNRAYAKSLPVMDNADDVDDMGVGYQIFVASFCDSDGDGFGDIPGITSKIPYFEQLKVDVLWLTPIQSSDSYHGYDCYDYYSIDPKFGTNADYRELVYKAHKSGIKVIMDLVVNHTSTKNEWFIKSRSGVVETVTYQDGTTKEVHYRDYYRWKQGGGGGRYCDAGDGWSYYSSFGSSMPELNYDCQDVRNAMADVAAYWMSFGLDGFRMDAIKHMFMWDESVNADDDVMGRPEEMARNYHFNMTKDVEWFKEFNYNLKSKYPNCYLLGENLTGATEYVGPFYAGMDSLFDFNTYYNLADRIKSGRAAEMATAFNNDKARYEAGRGGVGRPINAMISSNHDIERLAYRCQKDVEVQKLYFGVTMTMPGLTWIYYGDEIGMYSESNNDDRMYRQSMKWTADWENKALPSDVPNKHYDDGLKSVEEQLGDENSLLYAVKEYTKLRNDNPVLINGNAVCSEENGLLKITVTDGKSTLVAYHNFSGTAKPLRASGTAIFHAPVGGMIDAYGTSVFKM